MQITIDGNPVDSEYANNEVHDLNKFLAPSNKNKNMKESQTMERDQGKEWHVVTFKPEESDSKYIGKMLGATVYTISYQQTRHSSYTLTREITDLETTHSLYFMVGSETEEAVKLIWHYGTDEVGLSD